MHRVALAVNPTAGKGRAARAATEVEELLAHRGVEVVPVTGRNAEEAARRVAAAVASGVDAVVAVGGDGMVHLVLQSVAGTDVALGIVPTGTGNDLARMLGLPRGAPARAALLAADLLAEGYSRRVDAVRAAGRWFGCVLGAGFDSRVNDRANRMSWPRGRLRYDVAMVAELRVFRPLPFTLTFDDGPPLHTDAMLVAVGNARSYGAGMRVTPNAEIDDGKLDVTVLGPVSKPEFLRTFPKVYAGTHVGHPAVTTRRARVVTIDSPGVSAYADGEPLGDLPLRCECVAGAVRVLAP